MNRICRILAVSLLGCFWLLAGCSSSDDDPAPPPACGEGMQDCDGICRDILRDPLHCGACGAACGESEACSEGSCVFTCPKGREDCGGCVDLDTDRNHCGACGTACKEGEQCAGGTCVLACEEDEERCGGVCVNTRSDDANCGACGRSCDDGLSCVEGVCQLACEGEEIVCAGTCVDIRTDVDNCGGCGMACGAEEVCVDAVCTCPAGMDDCGQGCIDITENVQHCGGCGIFCEGRPNAQAGVCKNSQCEFICDPGFADCDGDPTNGCEVDLSEDPLHCGGCGDSCYTQHVLAAVCVESMCSISECEPGWGNCDGDASTGAGTGCETDLMNNAEHCGACGTNCMSLPGTNNDGTCELGVCAFTCAPGFVDCDEEPLNGCEVREEAFEDSLEHCGGCNIACGGGELCVAGVCIPDYSKANWPLPPDGPTDYKDNGDGTITDNVTGLIWQKGIAPDKMSLADAVAYCANDPLGDQQAWRLPTAMELMTLLDNTRSQPAINESFFTDTPSSFGTADFWTATPNVNLANQYWSINFAYGAVATKEESNTYAVRCVRGEGKWVPGERYVLTEETVEDTKTGLVWQRVLDLTPGTGQDVDLDFEQAQARCEALTLAGKSDWRLPTQKEQASIVDWSRNNPSIDTEVFPDTPPRPFWSTTATHIANTNWIVHFQAGGNSMVGHTAGMMQGVHSRCVRDAD